MLLPRDNKVVVTQHIKNIETKTETQYAKQSARWTLAINTETWRSRTHYSSSGERRSRREQQSDAEEERKAMDASGAKNAARRKASKLLLVGRRQPRAERL